MLQYPASEISVDDTLPTFENVCNMEAHLDKRVALTG